MRNLGLRNLPMPLFLSFSDDDYIQNKPLSPDCSGNPFESKGYFFLGLPKRPTESRKIGTEGSWQTLEKKTLLKKIEAKSGRWLLKNIDQW
jgi:hypothetical protein